MADSISERIFVDFISCTKRISFVLDNLEKQLDKIERDEQFLLLDELLERVRSEYSTHKNISEQDSSKLSALNDLQYCIIHLQMERGNFANVLELVKSVEDGWRIYMDTDYDLDGLPEEAFVFDKMLSLAKDKNDVEDILDKMSNYSFMKLKFEELFTKIFKRANELQWRKEDETEKEK